MITDVNDENLDAVEVTGTSGASVPTPRVSGPAADRPNGGGHLIARDTRAVPCMIPFTVDGRPCEASSLEVAAAGSAIPTWPLTLPYLHRCA